jgi:hypothetical protein
MESLLRLNAIAAVAGVDKNSPFLDTPISGQVPPQGNKLTLDNPYYIWAILGGIGGSHLVVFILAAYLANKVIVVQDSYLATSLLLEPVVEKLRESGVSVQNKRIWRALKDLEVAYGSVDRPAAMGTGMRTIRHLEISDVCERPLGGGGRDGTIDADQEFHDTFKH